MLFWRWKWEPALFLQCCSSLRLRSSAPRDDDECGEAKMCVQCRLKRYSGQLFIFSFTLLSLCDVYWFDFSDVSEFILEARRKRGESRTRAQRANQWWIGLTMVEWFICLWTPSPLSIMIRGVSTRTFFLAKRKEFAQKFVVRVCSSFYL